MTYSDSKVDDEQVTPCMRRTSWQSFLTIIPPIFAVLFIIIYGVGRRFYAEFYGVLGLTPEDVGLTELRIAAEAGAVLGMRFVALVTIAGVAVFELKLIEVLRGIEEVSTRPPTLREDVYSVLASLSASALVILILSWLKAGSIAHWEAFLGILLLGLLPALWVIAVPPRQSFKDMARWIGRFIFGRMFLAFMGLLIAPTDPGTRGILVATSAAYPWLGVILAVVFYHSRMRKASQQALENPLRRLWNDLVWNAVFLTLFFFTLFSAASVLHGGAGDWFRAIALFSFLFALPIWVVRGAYESTTSPEPILWATSLLLLVSISSIGSVYATDFWNRGKAEGQALLAQSSWPISEFLRDKITMARLIPLQEDAPTICDGQQYVYLLGRGPGGVYVLVRDSDRIEKEQQEPEKVRVLQVPSDHYTIETGITREVPCRLRLLDEPTR